MAVLLPTDTVAVHKAPRTGDGHGWALPPAGQPVWTGPGNLQEDPATVDTAASDLGGAGPFAPRAARGGVLYVGDDCPVEPGDVLAVRGAEWVARVVQIVLDPVRGPATSLVVRVTERQEVDGG